MSRVCVIPKWVGKEPLPNGDIVLGGCTGMPENVAHVNYCQTFPEVMDWLTRKKSSL